MSVLEILCFESRYIYIPSFIYKSILTVDDLRKKNQYYTNKHNYGTLCSLLKTSSFHGLRFDGTRFDCGDKIGFLHANIAFALQRDDMGQAVAEIIREISSDL